MNSTPPGLYPIEYKVINFLSYYVPFLKNYLYDKLSARITLGLLFLGALSIINEICITIDMFFLSKATYSQLKKVKNLEDLLDHELLVDPKYFAKEIEDGVEQFESMENFFKKPVHVSHVSVFCAIINGKDKYQPIADRPLKFDFEFAPEDFETSKYSPDYGCNLYHLKTKIYHFFKDSNTYKQLDQSGNHDLSKLSISKSIHLYNSKDEAMDNEKLNELPLCFLKIESGDRLKCEIVIQ